MKKFILIAIGGLLTSATFSQVRLGAQVSGNLSAASFETKVPAGVTADLTKTPVAGFSVGVSSEIALGETFSLRPSLNLMHKGVELNAKLSGLGGKSEEKGTNSLYYAELPVNFTYNIALGNNKVFVGVGPSVGYGIFGKSKSTYTLTVPGEPTTTEKEKVDAFKKESKGGAGFNRFDVSANAIAGVQFNSGLYVNAGYNMGLKNALKDDNQSKYKNRGIQFTVGYMLGSKN